MKNKTNLLIYSLIITIGLFVYLTVHHYAVQLGLNGPGFCSISETVNCDAAASSAYSEIFHIPIAVLGLCFSFVMLFVVLFKKMSWLEDSEEQNGLVRMLFIMTVMISIILAVISVFQIKVICPFCLGTYVFSFINLYLAWSVFSPAHYNLARILPQKGTWVIGLGILILSWLISGTIQDKYGLKQMKQGLPEKIMRWQNSTPFTFSSQLGIVQNPRAAITVVEFADFKCHHCKVASQSLHSFMQGHRDVQFIFKTFPLDGTCNPHVQFKGDGSRCKMAAWVLCAEKVSQRGWDIHQWYFDHQEDLERISDLKETNTSLAQKFNLNFDEVEKCSESVTIYDEIKKMADEAKVANVEGTPTIFLNGKKLEVRSEYLSLGLKSALETLK